MKIDIDYVVPMVFPDDLKWRHDYLTATGSFRDDRSTISNPRFRSWGTEELLIRCIRKNLPWIRTIHIILARKSQLQPWMQKYLAGEPQDTPSVPTGSPSGSVPAGSPSGSAPIGSPRCSAPAVPAVHSAGVLASVSPPAVRIVFHKDIMPKEALPTFNSRAIEMYLHRIPGLAPYFLYGNDDMFPISPMPVSDFFRPSQECDRNAGIASCHVPSLSGDSIAESPDPSSVQSAGVFASDLLPCLHYTERPFNPSRPFQVACMNGLNFVADTVQCAERFPRSESSPLHFTDHWLRIGHNVAPILRSTCELFWQKYPKQMQASVTPFRLPKNFNQYIYSWYQILSGQYIDHRAPRTYISVDAGINDIIQAIRTADGLLCINDNNSVNDITNLAATIRSEIAKRL